MEPKFGKGYMEPDIFLRLPNSGSMFIEVQRSIFTKETMNKKMALYQRFYEDFADKHWNGLGIQVKTSTSIRYKSPPVLILTKHQYNIDTPPFLVIQEYTVAEGSSRIQKIAPAANRLPQR